MRNRRNVDRTHDEVASRGPIKRHRNECASFPPPLLRTGWLLMAFSTLGFVHFLHSGISGSIISPDEYVYWMSDSFSGRQHDAGPHEMVVRETGAESSNRILQLDSNHFSFYHSSFMDECLVEEKEKKNGTLHLALRSQTPLTPTFIIAGAQKSGTSALYYLLKTIQRLFANSTALAATNHTVSIHSSIKFESHFFTHQMKYYNNQEMDAQDVCTLRQLYRQEFDIPNHLFQQHNHSIITFEKSPIYLCKPQIPSFIHQVAPWTKILLLLRNPIDRAFSNWKMDQSRNVNHNLKYHPFNHTTANTTTKKKRHVIQSFRQVIDREVKSLKRLKLITAPTLSEYLNATLEEKELYSFRLIKSISERNGGGMHHSRTTSAYMYQYRKVFCHTLSRGMYAQQLYFWLHPDHGGIGPFRPDQNLHVIPYESFSKNQTAVLQMILNDLVGLLGRDDHSVMTASLRMKHLEKDYSPGRYGNPSLQRKRLHLPNFTSTAMNSSWFVEQVMLGLIEVDPYTFSEIHSTITYEEVLSLKLDIRIREYLQRFYQPYQEELVHLLGTEWQYMWE